MDDFKNRRENILNVFSQAKADLEQLNADIDAKITANKETIANLQAANNDLASLKTSNESSIKVFSKTFKI